MRGSFAILCLTAGCATAPTEPLPANLTSVDIQSAIDSLAQAYPDALAFAALNYEGRGVIFATDGTATFVSPRFNQRVETTVSGFDGNTICIAEAGNFAGLCIDLYETEAGTYYCDETQGDGKAAHYDCTIMPAREIG